MTATAEAVREIYAALFTIKAARSTPGSQPHLRDAGRSRPPAVHAHHAAALRWRTGILRASLHSPGGRRFALGHKFPHAQRLRPAERVHRSAPPHRRAAYSAEISSAARRKTSPSADRKFLCLRK